MTVGMGLKYHCALALAGLCLLWPPPTRAADKPAEPPHQQKVVKLVATSADRPDFGRGRGMGGGGRNGNGPGRNAPTDATTPPPAGYVVVAPPEGGQPVRLTVTDDFRRKLPGVSNLRGELVTITLKPASAGDPIASSVVAFDGPKALKSPKAYVFDGVGEQKVGVQTHATAKLSKFGQSREALIPNRNTVVGGKPQPDSALLERLRMLKPGDVIDADLAPGPTRGTLLLVDFDVPRDPVVGEFVKLVTVKDGTKSLQGVSLIVEGQEKTFLFPVPAASSAPLGQSAAAIPATARRLQPGYGVRFVAKDAPDAARPALLRELRLDGEMLPTGDKSWELVSTYVRIEFTPARFGGINGINVAFRVGSNRPEDRLLNDGVDRVLESDDEAKRLAVSEGQAKQLATAHDVRLSRQDTQPTQQERTQWANAYQAWLNAADDTTRARHEHEMLQAAQELSTHWRKDLQAKYGLMRSILTAEQLEGVIKLGQKRD
jgi:hypothetical protein